MNLLKERLHILRALSEDEDYTFVCDLSLPVELRPLMRDISHEEGREEQRQVQEKLLSLYSDHGIAIIRSILEHAFLIHTTYEIEPSFSPLVEKIVSEYRERDIPYTTLIKELGRFAHSPYKTTHHLINLFLDTFGDMPGFLCEIVRMKTVPFDLRFRAAQLIKRSGKTDDYPAVVSLVDECCQEGIAGKNETWLRCTMPAVRFLGQLGEEGLRLAVDRFDAGGFGKHGPFVIANFNETFHRWFSKQNMQPAESWARVLIQAWRLQPKLENRDHLLSLLIDDWGRERKIAEYVRNKIKQAIDEDPSYLSACSEDLAKSVRSFTGRTGQAKDQYSEKVLTACGGKEGEWKSFLGKSFKYDKRSGWAVADALHRAPSTVQAGRLEELFVQSGNPRFLNAFFNRILLPNIFPSLPKERKLLILNHPEADRYVTTDRLDGLMERLDDLEEETKEKITLLYNGLVKQGALQFERTKPGGLE